MSGQFPEFVSAMPAVARELLGEPNEHLSNTHELRFGSRGSLSVDLRKGTFADHENGGVGGGLIDFVRRERRLGQDDEGKREAVAWLQERGHLAKPEAAAKPRIVKAYDYLTADGVLAFQVVRYEPKTFKQRRPDGTGGWIWKMAGVALVPYRLTDVITAIAAGITVYIVEGEKSADALAGLGLVATCSPAGAGKWRPNHSKALTGADVVILPDNDAAGANHAAIVAAGLAGKATRVRVLHLPNLPPKGDVVDWLAAGGTADQLVELINLAPDADTTLHAEQVPETDHGSDITEDGVALAFTAQHGDDLRFCHHSQSWFVWTGSYWRREESRLAFSWARQICREMGRNVAGKERTKVSKAAFAAAVERFAQADRAFAVTAETWDQNPWLLGTPAGTVDLRTGMLRASSRADHITKRTSVAPAPPGTPHPVWSAFLDQATNNDKELQAFLRRLVGYCLTGDVTEEVLAFLYGEGGTGKGTLLGAVVAIMGDYAVAVPIEVFTAGTRLNLEYYRAQMAGARMVTASETESGATWAESQIKEMTGNEAPLSGRHPYGKPFTFRPQFKIILVGNHAPRLKGRSKAMERRMRITPFKHKPAKPDHGLKDRLRGEFPAILRWMIDGCLEWQNTGLTTCNAVADETGTYFEQQDHFGRWLGERCIVGGAQQVKPSKALADFLAWAKESGEASISSGEFRELAERTSGLRYAMVNGGQWIKGLGLKPTDGVQSRPWDADR